LDKQQPVATDRSSHDEKWNIIVRN